MKERKYSLFDVNSSFVAIRGYVEQKIKIAKDNDLSKYYIEEMERMLDDLNRIREDIEHF